MLSTSDSSSQFIHEEDIASKILGLLVGGHDTGVCTCTFIVKFDPTRFEGRGPAPYTYVPFGGGPRMCPGKEYTRLEVLVFMHHLVKRFKFQPIQFPSRSTAFRFAYSPTRRLIPAHKPPLLSSPSFDQTATSSSTSDSLCFG